MQTTKISIILPTYNESKNIWGILDHIQKHIPKDFRVETIVVDDNSPDNTADITENYFYSIKEKTSHTINIIKRKAKKWIIFCNLKWNSRGFWRYYCGDGFRFFTSSTNNSKND